MKQENMAILIEKVNLLKAKKIPNLQCERVDVDWLYKTNIYLAEFIHKPNFENLILWKFEDENQNEHMELADKNKDGEE